MDPVVGSALVKVGGSLLGGLFGKKPVSAFKNTSDAIWAQAKTVREAAAKYGWNPLTLLGASSAVGPSAAEPNFMGAAIADAAAYAADGISEAAEQKSTISAQQAEIQRLQKEVIHSTVRPRFGGVYEQGAGGRLAPVVAPDVEVMADGTAVDITALLSLADEYAKKGPEFTEAATDTMKAVPIVPYYWGGQYFTPNPDYPDASLVEEMMGDEGPGATAMNWEQGMAKLSYHYGQTPWGMAFKGWARGDYDRIDQDRRTRDLFEMGNRRVMGFNPNHRDGYYVK